MANDDMPSFGEEAPRQEKGTIENDMPGSFFELPPETRLSIQDQKDAVKKVVKMFVILAAALIGSVLLFNVALFGWHKITVGRAASSLQAVLDSKLIDAERTKYSKQYDDWVTQVQPDYDQYYPYKSEYEFQKIVGSHKRLMQYATKRLDYVESEIKGVLARPEKSELQITEAVNLWADWKNPQIIEMERAAKEEERQIKQYFLKIKPKVELSAVPAPAPPVTAPAAAVAVPASTVKPKEAPVQAVPVAKLIVKAAPAAAAPVKPKSKELESETDKQYLEDVQKMLNNNK